MAAAIALPVYALALAAAAALVWRRPVLALFVFVVGLALHNLVMALLWGAGVRGASLDAIQAWKETLLALVVARIALDAWRARRLPFRPGAVDWLALAFAAVIVVYALVPQHALGGRAGTHAIAYALRHDLLPVAFFLVGRALVPTRRELSALAWTIVGAAAAVAAFGIVEEYTVTIEWWRSSGAVGYFRDQLGFDYHGPGGLPENFAFNTADGLFRRLVSTFVSPLATGYMLVVALLLGGALRRRPRVLVPLAALCAAGLAFTFSRSSYVALAGALLVLALALRRWWPLPLAVATVAGGFAFAAAYPSIAPRTHWFANDLPYQIANAKAKGTLPTGSGLDKTASLDEPSIKSHLRNLRDGLEAAGRHPQGYGLGNAGATASRFDVRLRAGESNYTELGVEAGIFGLALFVAWSLALLAGLIRVAWTRDDPAAAGAAAALAAVLAVAVQTDAIGIPWLAYCLWWLCGSLLEPAPATSVEATEDRGVRRAREQAQRPQPVSSG